MTALVLVGWSRHQSSRPSGYGEYGGNSGYGNYAPPCTSFSYHFLSPYTTHLTNLLPTRSTSCPHATHTYTQPAPHPNVRPPNNNTSALNTRINTLTNKNSPSSNTHNVTGRRKLSVSGSIISGRAQSCRGVSMMRRIFRGFCVVRAFPPSVLCIEIPLIPCIGG